MKENKPNLRHLFRIDNLTLAVFDTREEMEIAAVQDFSEYVQEIQRVKDVLRAVFVVSITPSDSFFKELTRLDCVDWRKITVLQSEEFIGLSSLFRQRFSWYLQQKLLNNLPLRSVEYIDGASKNIKGEMERYEALIKKMPIDIVTMNIGINGNIAINDPPVSYFDDLKMFRTVMLEERFRKQQVNEGRFKHLADVPKRACSLSIPALMSAGKIIVPLSGMSKSSIVRNTLLLRVSEQFPATILRRHPDATLYVDMDAAEDFLLEYRLL